MKKNAMVITTKVCRRTRSAISPSGTATSAATRPPSGSSAKMSPPGSFHCLVSRPTVYAPVPKNTALPSEM